MKVTTLLASGRLSWMTQVTPTRSRELLGSELSTYWGQKRNSTVQSMRRSWLLLLALRMEGATWKTWEGTEFFQQPVNLEEGPETLMKLQSQPVTWFQPHEALTREHTSFQTSDLQKLRDNEWVFFKADKLVVVCYTAQQTDTASLSTKPALALPQTNLGCLSFPPPMWISAESGTTFFWDAPCPNFPSLSSTTPYSSFWKTQFPLSDF